MKKTLQHLLFGSCAIFMNIASAQTTVTGPSSSQTPFVLPSTPNTTVVSIFTATQTVGSYTMCGIMDGMGAYDNFDGTFTALINHELGNSVGAPRAHGHIGAFVSKWIINKSTFSVVSGSDLIQNLHLWNGTGYTTYNSLNTSTLAAIGRLCSADLPAISAYYNSTNGKGTQNRIFMCGEEVGAEGRVFAHIATGPNAGNSYELPFLGKFSWENAVANPFQQDKTIVLGTDDSSPGQVYVYIGTKTNTGADIDKAGLTGGNLYGVAVSGMIAETSTAVVSAGTTFSLVNLGNVSAITGASLNTISNSMNITNFLRPEDAAWDPSAPNDLYFNTTNGFGNPSRLYRLRFSNIAMPENGGTITAVLDGTEGQQMLDNLGIDGNGHVLLQEDPGNQTHNAKIWQYDIATDVLTQIASHDPARFITGGSNFLTQDEESSGIIDAGSILGQGWFLFVDQAHYGVPSPVVEGGQLLALYKPSLATGINTVSKTENAFNLYPNPANNNVTLVYSLATASSVTVKVSDVQGKVVFETLNDASSNSVEINTSGLNNGIYIVELKAGGFVSQSKLVVTH